MQKNTKLTDLPKDMINKILSYLGPVNSDSAGKTCKTFEDYKNIISRFNEENNIITFDIMLPYEHDSTIKFHLWGFFDKNELGKNELGKLCISINEPDLEKKEDLNWKEIPDIKQFIIEEVTKIPLLDNAKAFAAIEKDILDEAYSIYMDDFYDQLKNVFRFEKQQITLQNCENITIVISDDNIKYTEYSSIDLIFKLDWCYKIIVDSVNLKLKEKIIKILDTKFFQTYIENTIRNRNINCIHKSSKANILTYLTEQPQARARARARAQAQVQAQARARARARAPTAQAPTAQAPTAQASNAKYAKILADILKYANIKQGNEYLLNTETVKQLLEKKCELAAKIQATREKVLANVKAAQIVQGGRKTKSQKIYTGPRGGKYILDKHHKKKYLK
jgi:hypothetical protein